MIYRFLLSLFAGVSLVVATAQAALLAPQFDDTIPPTTSGTAFPTQVPVGKTLLIPVAASNPNGGALIYSATSNNPSVMVRVRTGNPVLNLAGDHVANSVDDIAVSGTLQLILFRDLAPNTASIMGGLAQGGYFDGIIFHRIIPGFMSQGGDPTGTGGGGPGFTFENEFKLPLIFTGIGQLAMANAGFDTATVETDGTTPHDPSYRASNGSQFFITSSSPRNLDFNHTIFGQMVRGWDTWYSVNNVETDGSDRPLSHVTITSASVTKSNDAVLFLSATGTGSALITVTISDTSTGVPVSNGTQFQVTAIADTTNDPVIVTPPSDIVVPFKGKSTVIVHSQDLEFDETAFISGLVLSNAGAGTIARSGDGSKIVIGANPVDHTGLLNVAMGAKQLNQTARGLTPDPFDYGVFNAGLGDKALIPQPATLTLHSGTAPAMITAASFLDKDSKAAASSYFGIINWGDGSISSGSNATIIKDPNSGSSKRFLVSGTHAYENPGIYPLRVTVFGNLGATAKANGVANVSAGTVLASGLTLSSNGGNISKKQVAVFQDQSPLSPLGAYVTSIDWGDGIRTSGTVLKLSGSTSFKVLGSHRYTDSATYPVNVSITKNSETANAWSLAQVSKISKPPFLPPFPQAHLSMTFPALQGSGTNAPPQNPNFVLTGTATNGRLIQSDGSNPTDRVGMLGTMLIRNTGNKKSTPGTVKFYSSTDGTFANPTEILYLGKHEFPIPALKPGAQVKISFDYADNGTKVIKNTVLLWSVGSGYKHDGTSNFSGLHPMFQVNWSDPVADQEPIERALIYGAFQ